MWKYPPPPPLWKEEEEATLTFPYVKWEKKSLFLRLSWWWGRVHRSGNETNVGSIPPSNVALNLFWLQIWEMGKEGDTLLFFAPASQLFLTFSPNGTERRISPMKFDGAYSMQKIIWRQSMKSFLCDRFPGKYVAKKTHTSGGTISATTSVGGRANSGGFSRRSTN